MSYQITVHEVAAQPMVGIREHTSMAALPGLIGQAFGELFACLGQSGTPPAGPPFIIYHSFADATSLDVEIGVPVARPLADQGRIRAGELPAGKEAHTLHVGPYDGVGAAYEALGAWVEENGQQASAPPRECYLNGPDDVSSPAEYQTVVVWPIRDR